MEIPRFRGEESEEWKKEGRKENKEGEEGRSRESSRSVYRHLRGQRRPFSSYRRPLFLLLHLSFSRLGQHNGETGSCRMQLRAECSQDTLWWIERDDAKHTESYTYANVRKFESSHIFFHEIKIYFVNIIKYVYNIYYIYYNYFNNKYLLTIIYWQLIIILKRAKK